LLSLCSVGNAQNLKVGIGGGVAFIQSPEGFTRDIPQAGLGFGVPSAIGIKAELSFPGSPFMVNGEITYLFMSGSGHFESSVYVPAIQGDVETKNHLFSLALGGEWQVFQGPVRPYLGADFLINSFGDLIRRSANSAGTYEYRSGGGMRYGFGVGVGTQFSITPTIEIDVSGKYNVYNVFGQERFESTLGAINTKVSVLFSVF
jgi:opacity protein-like surface antigen